MLSIIRNAAITCRARALSCVRAPAAIAFELEGFGPSPSVAPVFAPPSASTSTSTVAAELEGFAPPPPPAPAPPEDPEVAVHDVARWMALVAGLSLGGRQVMRA